jgi:two-component system chemotaxis response regulator CheB
MSRKIRVLVVDDSAVVRRLLSEVIAEDPALEVAGTAPNGKVALSIFDACHPDAITLDIEMPEMDGIQALVEIRKKNARIPVIMFSSLTERGAAATFEALSHGANDYVTKPANTSGLAESRQRIRDDLNSRIKALAGRYLGIVPISVPTQTASAASASTERQPSPPAVVPPVRPRIPSNMPRRVDVLAIGISTGGPNALAVVIPKLPTLPVPVVIVQHMPPLFTRLLAERLAVQSKNKIVEAQAGMELNPGVIYIAPGNYHMVVETRGTKYVVGTNQDAPENSCRPAADVLFRSVAQVFGQYALGLVMTGMGQDGLRGVRSMREAGARILVQDEPSSVVWGMPGAIAKEGLADKILPLEDIADEISKLCQEARIDRGRVS